MSTPKTPARRPQSLGAQQTTASTASSLLDVFPVWQDQIAGDKEPPVKYEDPLGTSLPPASQPFCDAWKRAEELLHGVPNVPILCLKPAADVERKGKGAAISRELDGKLYAGHETFDWLLGVISYVVSAEKYLKRGEYLWELIHPKDKDGLPSRSPTGKYRVKLFILDTWRSVTVDDRIPVDLFGRALLVGSRPLQLWPLLLCKAILKVMAVYRSLEMTLPHQVAAFQMLTGWPQEDLLDPLGGTTLSGGALFDRLEEVLGGPLRQVQEVAAVASCCLVRRSKPQRAPPRLVVLAGPSGVGRSHLIARLVAEYPDKFGVTVSHTSRPPREHEMDGRDYYFTNKHKLLTDVRSKKFLEAARVTVHARPCTSSAAAAAAAPPKPVSYWYGTSLATVREVAATGKLCLMSLDMQGAEALRSNKRIDGLYLYLNTSSLELLASRQKQRLAEAPSTLTKRLTWAKQQVAKSSTPGLFDAVIPNTSISEVYAALKEAISTLSPIIRNRLRGLPAYVLDYSDLIPPNSVEKPFLKPVILAGPNIGERRKLLEMLAEEFPDVFAFPRQHTTQPPDEHSRHLGADGDELQLVTDQPGSTPRLGTSGAGADADAPASCAAAGSGGAEADRAGSGAGAAGGKDGSASINGSSEASRSLVLGPAPVVLSKEEFEAAASGGKFLEAHADMFRNPLVVHKHGHTMENVREVIKSGKLPLMELEAEGAEAIKVNKNVDCLTIFLAPPSMEVHEQRLKEWVTESDKEIAERQAVAAAELAAVQSKGVFDQVVVNDDLDEGYKQIKAAISKFRPDLIPPAEDEAAAQAAKKAAANQPVPLLVLGPAGGGREQLVQQLQQRYPHRFVVPRRLTDRKPGKGEKELSPDLEYVKPDLLAKLAAQGQLVHSQQDPANSTTLALTADALHDLGAAGKMAIVDIGAASVEQLQAVRQHPAMKGAFAVLVCRKAVLAASLSAAGVAEAAAAPQLEKAADQLQEVASSGLIQAVVKDDDPEEAFAQLQEPLSVASPWAMPPLLMPLVVAAPFGSGKRAVLQRLVKMLPEVFAVPRAVTSKPRSPGSAEDMEVVSPELAQHMQQEGKFLVEQQVLGHVYGITAATVRKLQASGKLPVLDLDRVADVAKLKASGFQATYIYLQPPSLEQLQQRISADILANPPLHHEPADAAQAAAAEAVREASAAAAQPELFDSVLVHDPQELLSTIGRLSEVLQQRYPSAVPSSFVWGYGRPLWDPSCRVHGLKPLKIMLLGPAASGKSTQCAMIAARFGIPHINAGDLLYAEVASKTPLGLEAKQYMDSSRTVPDRVLLTLLLRRLAAADCQAQGWTVDGFPHTKKQAEALADAGHVPDKVIMLEGPHALLLDRVKYRRIDYHTGIVYHLAEPGALSEAVRPVRPDGSPDTEVLARLAVRHDDSLENVANRLALWDRQVQGLCAAYADVLLRLPAAGSPDDICAKAESFVKLEATTSCSNSPGSIWPIVASHQLEELMYRVVATTRYKRQQMVQLQQLDGKLDWCDLKELSRNSSCMLLAHNPSGLPVVKSIKRLDSASIARQQLLAVESQEPFRLLTCLAMGPQHPALPPAPFSKKVFVLAGPAGAGRTTLARQLLQDFGDKLMPAALLTNRSPHMLEVSSSSADQQPGSAAAAEAEAARQWSSSSCASSQAGGVPAVSAAASASVAAAAGPSGRAATGCMQPVRYRGSELLQLVPQQQFKVLQRSNQLVGMHKHLGHSYSVAAAALEAIAAEGKGALVVGPLLLAEQLRKDLPGTQVVCVYIEADTASLDCRLRVASALEEERLQLLLQDASQQRLLLLQLLEQQVEDVKEEQLRQQAAAAAATAAAALLPSVPATPQAGGAAGLSKLAAGSSASGPVAGALKPLQQQQATAALAAQQQQPPQQESSLMPAAWLHHVSNAAGQLQVCYSQVKGVLAKHWPVQQQRLPGLLLVQRHIAGDVAAANGNAAGGAAAAQPQGAAAAAAASGACLDEDVYSQSRTVLRLKSITAAASMLQLPRGKHLLQLQCSPLLLHCMTFYAAGDFTLDEAAKLLPAAYGQFVATHEGQHEALQPGSRQLLFRYQLKPSESCLASFDLRTSSSALQSCSQLLLVSTATRQVVSHVLNQPSQVQLAASDKGYVLLALAEPHTEVPASSWSVTITSSKPLQPLQDLSVARQAAYEGVYSANAKASMARYVVSPTASVQLAVLSQLSLPAGDSSTAQSPTSALAAVSSSTRSGDSSAGTPLPLSYSLQLFDTAGAKETTWGASYKLLADAPGGANGRAMLPSVQLQPGRYLVVLQLHTQASQQWVDPVTGSTCPAPNWQLLLLPSADDKVCPIVRDDASERHFKSTTESWQQQAAHTASTSRPSSSGITSASGARLSAVAAKDRPRQAQAALDRYMAAEQAAAPAAGLTALSIPGSAAGGAAAGTALQGGGGTAAARRSSNPGGKTKLAAATSAPAPAAAASAASGPGSGQLEAVGSYSNSGSLQVTPRFGSAASAASSKQPVVVVRQLKGSDVLTLSPMEQVKHVVPATATAVVHVQAQQGGAGDAAVVQGYVQDGVRQSQVQQGATVIGPSQLAERLQQQQVLAERSAAQLSGKGGQQQPIGALQAKTAADFSDWRSKCLAEQQAVISHKQEVLKALMPNMATAAEAAAMLLASAPTQAAAGHKQGAGKARL